MVDDTVLDDELLRLDSTQHATEKELRIFQRTNGVYEVATLKPSGCLVAEEVALKENSKLQGQD